MLLKNGLLFSATLAVLFAVFTGPAFGQSFLTNGLVAYYPFNGNASDQSGNANDGSVIGAVLCADRFGQPNSAYQFDGVDNYIGFTSPPTTQIDNVTISAWVNPDSTNQFATAVCLGYDDANTADGFALGMAADNYYAGNHVSGFLGGVTWLDSGAIYPATNVWCQVVMLRRAGVTSFYLNGMQTPFTDSSIPFPPSAFTIGSSSGIRFFSGKIDDVRIYNRALTDNEVQQLYQMENINPAGCTPHQATATAVVTSGFVTGANMVDYGCGYTNAPLVLIQGGGGSSATATAVFSEGSVVGINIINAGSGYTNAPQIVIASPPFIPTLNIAVSRVNVTQHVQLGLNYILQSSPDLVNWTATGPQFTAQSETIVTEIPVNQTNQYFRILQVP